MKFNRVTQGYCAKVTSELFLNSDFHFVTLQRNSRQACARAIVPVNLWMQQCNLRVRGYVQYFENVLSPQSTLSESGELYP